MIHSLSIGLLLAGAGFFLAGTVGLLRFPDVYTRLHALTKADNLGLGLIVLGLMLRAESAAAAGKLLVIWLLVLTASGAASQLVASWARARRIKPWQG
ncbi:monovalent cation/H(+) antiporter subunit G [uncultured Thiohalocapsa sp.]|uniref:monovalent cation/H(+) antiporter subunit G n=1 Tax=uncultured Thiohalocapsa sp. TaxID=768990 RepID=UPI0025F669A0|nr:monovalent cation/H(+) antiporter subunit G [uncultured Thiohalocapsa sp.]